VLWCLGRESFVVPDAASCFVGGTRVEDLSPGHGSRRCSDTHILLKGDDVYPFFGRASLSRRQLLRFPSAGDEARDLYCTHKDESARLTQSAQGVLERFPYFCSGRAGHYPPFRIAAVHRTSGCLPLNVHPPGQLTSGPGLVHVSQRRAKRHHRFLNSPLAVIRWFSIAVMVPMRRFSRFFPACGSGFVLTTPKEIVYSRRSD